MYNQHENKPYMPIGTYEKQGVAASGAKIYIPPVSIYIPSIYAPPVAARRHP
jgi:hypothetical protein